MRENGYDSSQPIDVVLSDGTMYIVDGHHWAAAARRTGTQVDVKIVDDIKSHHSNFNSIDDVIEAAGSVSNDRLRP